MIDIRSFLYVFFLYGGILIFVGLFYLINFLLMLMPIVSVGSLAGLAYFKSNEASEKRIKFAKVGVVIGLIGSLLSFGLNLGVFWFVKAGTFDVGLMSHVQNNQIEGHYL